MDCKELYEALEALVLPSKDSQICSDCGGFEPDTSLYCRGCGSVFLFTPDDEYVKKFDAARKALANAKGD